MAINERLRFLRNHLGLTTRSFGESIGGMSGGAITNMEKGTRNITDRTIRDICRTHNVNPEWLINGIGLMFNESKQSVLPPGLDLTDEVKELTTQYTFLGEKDREIVRDMIDSLYEKTLLLSEKETSDSLSNDLSNMLLDGPAEEAAYAEYIKSTLNSVGNMDSSALNGSDETETVSIKDKASGE